MQSVPASLQEAALIDGASYPKVFFKIMVPLCTPIIVTVGLFASINHWNAVADTRIYNNMNKSLHTLQYVLYQMMEASVTQMDQAADMGYSRVSPMSLRMALTGVTMLPVLILYPFVQKHLISGIMIGAVKG